MNKINIIGLGYVGLTLGVALARKGISVTGFEINESILSTINKGEAHFFEPGLNVFLKKVLEEGFFTTAAYLPKAKEPEIYVITVGTPLDESNNASMASITSVVNEIAKNCAEGSLIITRSTTKIGTTRNTLVPIFERAGKNVHFAVCPERTVEGKALDELHEIPQVIGSPDQIAQKLAQDLFINLAPSTPILNTWEGAETVKLMDNTYRDIQFAVANEFAQVIEEINEDANRVISIANSGYGRTNIAKPGLVGGPCLEKDPIIFAQSAKALGVDMPITMAARAVNQNSIHHGISRITNYFKKNGKKIEKVLIFGLAFKGNPSTSDTRGSLAIPFINTMKKNFNEVKIFGYDEHVMTLDMMGIDCTLVDDFYTAAENSDLVVIQHDAQYIKDIDLNKISNLMNNSGLIYDFWNLHSMSSLTMQKNVSYLSYGSLMGEQ